MAHASLVSESAAHVRRSSDPLAVESRATSGLTETNTPLGCESNSSSNRLACLQQSWQKRGIPSNASTLLLTAWRPGTSSVYDSAWKKWHCWCLGRKVDPFCPSLADIVNFLPCSFDEGLEYRTINTYRLALSSTLSPIEGFPLGQHRIVVRLLKDILNLRPAICLVINRVGMLTQF